jgi:hypothetical protein
MRTFRYMPTQAAVDAAEWFRREKLPSEQWILAPDLCHYRFEILRRQNGVYETRWCDDGSPGVI